ncbi:MAG: hypothetical protein U1E46_10760 [Hyphomicrobiales bacterium]
MRPTSLQGFRPLTPAEERIVADLDHGDFDRLGDGSVPEQGDAGREVRAAFLRFLALGGDVDHRPHEKGVRISGAWISGLLDLEGCRIPRDLGLKDCRFDAAPVLRSAVIDSLFLDGSHLPGLQADRLEARGDMTLRAADVSGEVRLAGARIGGALILDGASIAQPGGLALVAEDLSARSVEMRAANVRGGVDVGRSRIGADLDLAGATIENAGQVALDGEAVEADGDLVLRRAVIAGEVKLASARLGGDLDLSGARLSNPGGEVVHLNRAVVRGGFFLRDGAELDGALDLTGATLDTIHDAAASWPKAGDLLLNRCLYNAFLGGPVDAASRLDWLSRQSAARWGEDFWPQPYELLAQVLTQMGHDEDARAVLIEKERLQRQSRRDRAQNAVWRALLSLKDGILGVTVGFGRQPLRAFAWLLAFWLLGVAVFGLAEARSALKPNSPVVLRSPEWTMCGVPEGETRLLAGATPTPGRAKPGETQLRCFLGQQEASSYPIFNAWMYSLDTLFPVLEIGQKEYWRPDPTKAFGSFAMGYFYFQAIVGWALSLLAIAGFSGLVKSR